MDEETAVLHEARDILIKALALSKAQTAAERAADAKTFFALVDQFYAAHPPATPPQARPELVAKEPAVECGESRCATVSRWISLSAKSAASAIGARAPPTPSWPSIARCAEMA